MLCLFPLQYLSRLLCLEIYFPIKRKINIILQLFVLYVICTFVILIIPLIIAGCFCYCFLSSPKDMLIDFREGGREEKKDGVKHQCERETLIGCLLHTSLQRTEPSTQVCALTGIEPTNFQLTEQYSNQLSHTSQGCFCFINFLKMFYGYGVRNKKNVTLISSPLYLTRCVFSFSVSCQLFFIPVSINFFNFKNLVLQFQGQFIL